MSKTTAVKKERKRFQFFGNIISELRKVVWPTRQEAIRLTLIVLAVCIAIGIILFAIDYGFTELAKKVFFGGE